MSKLTKFQNEAVQNETEVKGGFFNLGSYCAPKPTHHCAPKPTHYCAPKPTHYCAPKLPKISFSFGYNGGCW